MQSTFCHASCCRSPHHHTHSKSDQRHTFGSSSRGCHHQSMSQIRIYLSHRSLRQIQPGTSMQMEMAWACLRLMPKVQAMARQSDMSGSTSKRRPIGSPVCPARDRGHHAIGSTLPVTGPCAGSTHRIRAAGIRRHCMQCQARSCKTP